MSRKWKPVPGFAGLYEISDDGLCRRIKATAKGVPNRIIAPKITKGGYHHYCLWRDGKPNWRLCHRLVVEAFIGPIPDGLEVNHLNGDKADNRPANLEIVTRSQNSVHRHKTLRVRSNLRPMKGTQNGGAKLDEKAVTQLRTDRDAEGISYAKLAKRYGITPRMAWLIVQRRAWGHI